MAIPMADPMQPRLFAINRAWKNTYDTFTLELISKNGSNGMAFLPGQFNMLYAFGAGEVPISISGDPRDPQRLIHTIRAVGTVTRRMRALKAGEVLGVRGPFGSHWPVQEAEGHDVVVVAGGIGLAPLRPVMYHLQAYRGKYGKVVLLYGARSPEEILYRRELEKWRASLDMEIQVTVDRATSKWHGHVGVVTKLIPKAPFDPGQTVAMVCGPEIMMRFTVNALVNAGVEKQSIYVSMERNMQCGIGLCGHCQYGPEFICKDGPVFPYPRIERLFTLREI